MKRPALASVPIATLAAAIVFAGSALSALPAAAGENALVFQVNPTTRAETRAVRRTLAGMAMRDEVRTNGLASAIAGANARGGGSTAIIQQRGSGHTGSITQTGQNHAYGLFQFGQNTTAHVTQQGRGQTGMTVIIGY